MDPEELSQYVDDLVMKKFPYSKEEKIQEKCADILAKYNSLDDKALFDLAYEYKFHERLVYKKEKCLEFDGAIIAKIREANPGFMESFESIKQYFVKSKEMCTEFEKTNEGQTYQYNPLIIRSLDSPHLSRGNIPKTLPSDYTQKFIDFCESKKEPTPHHYYVNNEFSMCELVITIGGKEYTVKSNFYISTILLSLIEKDMTFNELVQRLDVSEQYTIQLLNILFRLKLIKKTGDDSRIEGDDVLCFNTDFRSTNKYIMIPIMLDIDPIITKRIIENEKRESIKRCIIRNLIQSRTIEKDRLVFLVIYSLNPKFFISPNDVFKEINFLTNECISVEQFDGKEIIKYIG